MNIAKNFIRTSMRFPDKCMVEIRGKTFSYREVLKKSKKFSQYLKKNGVEPGDRIIINIPNSIDYICAYIGSLIYDCTVIPVDCRYDINHIESIIQSCSVSCVITLSKNKFISKTIKIGINDFLEEKEIDDKYLFVKRNPLALIIHTSGSTGIPKGVKLSNLNLSHTVNSIISWSDVTEFDKEIVVLPLTHLFALAHLHVFWTVGATIYLEKFVNIQDVLETISIKKITSFIGTPSIIKILIDSYSKKFVKSAKCLKRIIINTAPLSEEYIKKLLQIIPKTKIYMYYGLTEASRSSFICYNENKNKLHTVGRPTPGTEISINCATKKEIGVEGEILIKGPHVTEGYWNKNSEKYFKDGWIKTGDLGVVDEDGFLTWTGRIKDQINIDGLKVSPKEIEEVLMKCQEVKDCAVVGEKDELTGERIVVFIVLKEKINGNIENYKIIIRNFCRKNLETFKLPKRINFCDSIPKTESGKVKRFELREKLLVR